MNNQENTMETKIYAEKFWKGMRGTRGVVDELVTTATCPIGCHDLPLLDNDRLLESLNKRSLFRRIASVKPLLNVSSHIVAYDSDDISAWVD